LRYIYSTTLLDAFKNFWDVSRKPTFSYMGMTTSGSCFSFHSMNTGMFPLASSSNGHLATKKSASASHTFKLLLCKQLHLVHVRQCQNLCQVLRWYRSDSSACCETIGCHVWNNTWQSYRESTLSKFVCQQAGVFCVPSCILCVCSADMSSVSSGRYGEQFELLPL
jgi:hypothetical protein